jgi:CAAX prenyl protease-like protein
MNQPEQTAQSLLDRIPDFWAYVIPMGIFLAFTQVGATWREWYPASYVVKTLLTAIALMLLWRHYTKIRWTHLGLGAVVGVVGLVQWVGMEKLLVSKPWLFWTRMGGSAADPASTFALPDLWIPHEHFASAWGLWGFLSVRLLGSAIVVAVMEELFWRDAVWRTIIAPNDFKLAEVGEWDLKAFLVVPAIFAMVHVQWLTAIVWALMIGWLLVRTRSLGACIVAHGVTNLLLGVYVMATGDWYFW